MSNYYDRVPTRRRLLLAFATIGLAATSLAVATAGPSFGEPAPSVVVLDDDLVLDDIVAESTTTTTTTTVPDQVTTTATGAKPTAVEPTAVKPTDDGGPKPAPNGQTPCDQGGAVGTSPSCPPVCDQGGPNSDAASSGSCAPPCDHGGATPADNSCNNYTNGALLPADNPTCLSHPTLHICEQPQPTPVVVTRTPPVTTPPVTTPPVTTPPSTTRPTVTPTPGEVDFRAGNKPTGPDQPKSAVRSVAVGAPATRQTDAAEADDADSEVVAASATEAVPNAVTSPSSSVALRAIQGLAQPAPTTLPTGSSDQPPTVLAALAPIAAGNGATEEVQQPGRRRLAASPAPAPALASTKSNSGLLAALIGAAGLLVGFAVGQGKRRLS